MGTVAATAAHVTTHSVQWGDVATWAGAVGSVIVAIVAVLPIVLAHRKRKARARLVAAFLYNPLALALTILKQERENLHEYTKVMIGPASSAVRSYALRLQSMCDAVPEHLRHFDLAEAASLPASVGEALADAVPQARTCIRFIEKSVERYLEADNLGESRAHRARYDAAHSLAFVLDPYDNAIKSLAVFVHHCRKEFEIS